MANLLDEFGLRGAGRDVSTNGNLLDEFGIDRPEPKAEGVVDTLKEGVKSTGRAVGAAVNTYTGNGQGIADKALAQQQAPKDPRLQKFMQDYSERTAALGDDPGVLETIGQGFGAVADNPAGAGLAVVEQLPNAAVALAGMKAGAAAGGALGSAAAGIGAVPGAAAGGIIGGIAGMFLGNAALETGHKAMGFADDGEVTPEEMGQAKSEGAIKGGVITGIDALTLGIGGKASSVMQRPTAAAMEAASRKVLIDNGVDVTSEAAVLAATKNPAIATAVRTAQDNARKATDKLGKRAAVAGTLLAMETVGEGLGEYLGELAATGEGNVPDAVLEGLLGLGQSGAEVAWIMARTAPGRMVQPQPSAENPAPAPVSAPDPAAGPISRTAAQLPGPSIAGLLPDPGQTLYGDAAGNLSPDGQPRNVDREYRPTGRERGPQTFGPGMDQSVPMGEPAPLEGQLIRGGIGARPQPAQRTAETFENEPSLGLPAPSRAIPDMRGDNITVAPDGTAVPGKTPNTPPAPYIQGGPGMDQQREVGKTYKGLPAANRAIRESANPDQLEAVKVGPQTFEVRPKAEQPDAPRPVLQNRDRSTPASITQMRSIAARPDYQRVSISRDFANGAPVVEPGAAVPSNRKGRAEVVSTASGRKISTQYAVIEASDLLPSHDINGGQNAEYATGAQGKSRAIAGNGRVTGISHAYTQGTAGEYRRELEADAAGHGISPEAIKGMKQPVLVRIMPQDQITQNIGDESNTTGVSGLSGSERAMNDARRINIDDMEFSESGEISETTVRQFVQSMPDAERNDLLDGTRPSRQAYDRAESAIFASAYESESLIELQAQAKDPEVRTVLAGLLVAAPKMARLKGAGAWDIRGLVVEAAEAAVNARRNGQTLEQYAQQIDLDRNPEAQFFIELFAENIRSAKRIGEELSAVADGFYTEVAKPEFDMLGAVPRRSRQDLLNGAPDADTTRTPANSQTAGNQAGAGTAAADGQARDAERAEPAGAGADARPESFQLDSYSEEELAAQAAAQAEAAAQAAAADKAAADKAQADRDRNDFTLSGSDRPADVAASRGQNDMFAPPTMGEKKAGAMSEQAKAEAVRTDGSTETLDGGMTIVHGSGNDSLKAEDIQIVRASGQKQGKKGRVYGGFYGTSEADADQAEGYAGMMGGTPTLYDVKIKPGTKVLNKTGDVTRLSEAYINELVSQGYGLVTGTDPRGRTEHVVIDKNAIQEIGVRSRAQLAATPSSRQAGAKKAEQEQAANNVPEVERPASTSEIKPIRFVSGQPTSEYLADGSTIEDGNGQQYRVHYQRNDLVVAHPIIDGKAQVNAGSTVRFHVGSPESADGRRTDPIYLVEGGSQQAPASVEQQLASMDEAELSALIDEISEQEAAPQTSKPKAKRSAKGSTPSGKPRVRATTSKAERTDTSKPADVKRSAGEIAKSLGVNMSSAGMNALEGLTQLFGGPGRLSSGLSFDEDTYAKAKPLFAAAMRDIQAAGKDLRDFIRALIGQFGDGVKPYILRYAQDLKQEQDSVYTGQRVEPDRSEDAGQAAGGDVGGADAGAVGRGNGRLGQGEGGQQRPDAAAGVSGRGAAAQGERGDQSLDGAQPAVEGGAAGTADGSGGRPSSTGGLFAGRDADAAADRAVAGAVTPAKANVQPSSKPGTAAEIKAQMPFLTDGQAEDVAFAERRLSKPDGYGVLYTNGTGTGKTFTGLGIAARQAANGKTNILIVAPKQTIADAWVKAGEKFFGLPIKVLDSTQDNGGSGIVVTTYANLGANPSLALREWDMVIADEAHYLSSAEDGSTTNALENLRALTKRRGYARNLVRLRESEKVARLNSLTNSIDQREKEIRDSGGNAAVDHRELARDTRERDELSAELDAMYEAEEAAFKAMKPEDAPRGVLLSATPFAYEKNVQLAQQFLFDWGSNEDSSQAYNSGGPFERFMMQHFGYRMRYNKLTEPDAKVDRGLMQRAFNSWLKREGALSARALDSEFDYDRKFVTLEAPIGRRVDDALKWLRNRASNRDEQGNDLGMSAAVQTAYRDLQEKIVGENFNYHARMYFLEAIKAREALPHIRAHLAKGRKVVVMHDFKQGGASNPFIVGRTPDNQAYNDAIAAFSAEFSDLQRAFSYLPSPIAQLTKAFPDALIYNGDYSAKKRVAMQNAFNDDSEGAPNLIIAQGDAMREGVSIHDTTGKHPRVLVHLGMPVKPTAAIQQEGRIYRTGQASHAMFRYFTIGSAWERAAFAGKIAKRAGAAENLAMGEQARGLKQAFIDAYENADLYEPGFAGEGQGGKESDQAAAAALTPWDSAKSFYFGTKVQGKGRSSRGREGNDYFATPEPVGLKMVEWADIRTGEDVLEPSAGHGAIARWFPDGAKVRVIEQSAELASRVALHVDGDVVHGNFEDHHIVNKYDAIVMNPPYGLGGAEAIPHLAKASSHLRDGGRVVALIPTGPAADKKFDNWFYARDKDGKSLTPGLHLIADVKMPGVTFERAGTAVATRLVVIEKVRGELVEQLRGARQVDLSSIDSIGELFDRLEHMEMPARLKPVEEEAEQTAPAKSVKPAKQSHAEQAAGQVEKLVTDAPIIEHTTAKGKVLKGVIVTDMSLDDVRDKLDKYAFRKDGGVFVRQEYIARPQANYRLNSSAAKGIPLFSARAIANRVMAATGLNATVVNTEADLPADLQAQIKRDKATGRVAGVYHNGAAYLVASNLRDTKHAISVMLHEAIGHGGVKSVLGDRIGKVMAEIYRDMPAAMRKELERRYSGQMASMSEADGRVMIAEEYVAHLAETDPRHSIINRLVALLRQFIRDTFGKSAALKWTRNDLVLLLAEARTAARNGGRGPGGAARMRETAAADALAALPEVDAADESAFVASLKADAATRSFASAMYKARGTESPFFKAWFGKSRMVDKQGQPIAFVHRSYGERDTFTDADLGKNTGTPTASLGHFLARKDVGNVERYGPVVEQFYIRMEKPKVITQAQFEAMGDWSLNKVQAYRKTLMDQGHDGLYIQGLSWPVVFEGKNIKAKRNQGTFDATASTRYSLMSDAADLFTRFGRQPADPNDPFAEENRRLREQDKSIWDKAKREFRRQFAPGGLLPDAVFGEKVKRDSEFQAVEFDVRHLARGLERAIKADFGVAIDDLPAEQMKRLADALAGKVDPTLPEDTKVAVVAMRQYIDSLSAEYIGILQQQVRDNLQGADAALIEKITGNIGSYVHRSYQAFDDPKWFQKVPTEVLSAARHYLAKGYMEQGDSKKEAYERAEVKVNEMLKTGTAYDSMESFIAEGKLGAKDLSVLIKRKSIAPEIRALLGEYSDPRLNFAKSATKMGRLIWNQRFLDRVREDGLGVFLFEGKDRPAGATVQIAGEASDTYAPLNGLWTFPDVAQAFKDSLGKEQMSDLYRTIVRLNGMVKYGKTVLSPTTAMRNWQSAMFFSLANGHFDLTQMKRSWAALREQVTQNATGDDLTYLRKLKQLGVVYDTPYAGEMMALLNDARMDELLSGKSGAGFKWLRKINEVAQGFYSFGDDFWKIIGFENEKASLIKAGIPADQAEQMAAERIRNTYPTYSMVGKGINWLRRFPLAGTFVSFPAEIIRTSVNMLQLTAADLKSDNPGLQAIGRKRVAGIAMVSAGFYALAAMTAAAFGVGDDEEEAIRDLAAPWQRNSTFLYTGRDADGKLRYFDMSFLDPYGYWKRPLTAMLRDQPWEKAAASGIGDMLSPFLGTDIAAGAIFEVLANKKASGGQVYQESAGAVDQTTAIADHLRKALQPGFVSNAERLLLAGQGSRREGSGQPYDMRDEVVSLLGWRASTLDTQTALYYRSFEFTDGLRDASKVLSRTLRSSNKVSDGDIRSARETAQTQYDQAFKEMGRLVNSARAAGMSNQQIAQTLKLSGVSQVNVMALLAGRVPPMNAATLQGQVKAVQQARLMQGSEHAQEIARRFAVARQL